MAWNSLIPTALSIAGIAISGVPANFDDAVTALLDIPAIEAAVPDDVEAWLKDLSIGGGSPGSTSSSDGPMVTKAAATSSNTTSMQRSATRNKGRTAPVLKEVIADGDRLSGLPTTTPAVEKSAPDIDWGSRRGATDLPVATKRTPALTIDKTSDTDRAPAATAGKEPFGQWVKEQTHSGIKGRELAERIHAEKAKRR